MHQRQDRPDRKTRIPIHRLFFTISAKQNGSAVITPRSHLPCPATTTSEPQGSARALSDRPPHRRSAGGGAEQTPRGDTLRPAKSCTRLHSGPPLRGPHAAQARVVAENCTPNRRKCRPVRIATRPSLPGAAHIVGLNIHDSDRMIFQGRRPATFPVLPAFWSRPIPPSPTIDTLYRKLDRNALEPRRAWSNADLRVRLPGGPPEFFMT